MTSESSGQHAQYSQTHNFQIVPLGHPLRNTAVGACAIFVAGISYSVFTNPQLQWGVVGSYMLHPLIVQGLIVTMALTVLVMICATVLGTIIALMMLSPSRMLSLPAVTFVWLFRGAPALVQLFLWYNLSLIFPDLKLWLPFIGTVFSIPTNDVMTPFVAAALALSLHEAGYMAEIIRGGLKTVSKGQTEAALSLGMHPWVLIKRIILPQAMKVIIPPTGNEAINLLKTTSLVSTIAVGDILYSAQVIYARTFETMQLLLVVAIWYLIVVSVLSIGQHHLEQHFAREERTHATPLLSKLFRILTSVRTKVAMP